MFFYKKIKLKNSFGMTMIELLVAVVILGLTLSYAYSIISSELKGIGKTRNYSAAVLAAQQTIEELRHLPFENLETIIAGTEYPKSIKIGDIDFSRKIKIEKTLDAANNTIDLKVVNVEITWSVDDGAVVTYKMTTCIHKNS